MTGQIISHFKVLEKLGGGGMGVVYLADDLSLNRKVALKFLPPHLSTDQEANERFIQEANAASALNHANVCTIHEIGRTEEGQTFIAMAHYEGETLKARLDRGALPTEEAIDIARQVAEGLSAAHEKGIIHRDIKPANIFITKRGRAVILDFGLAKLTGALDLTKSGSTLGTAYYMSPEQIRGEPVDHRTDVWSLGVVLYEMLAGHRPFTGEYDQAISYAILNQEVPRLMNQSAFLEGIVGETLRRNVDDRTESASKLAERLKAAASSTSAGLREHEKQSQLQSRSARLKIPLLISSAAAGIAIVAIAMFILRSEDSSSGENEVPIRLVVLPFRNLGPSDLDYMGPGIAEDIATRLMALPQLEIRATRSASRLPEGQSYTEIGEELKVDFIVDGSLQADETEVRLSPKLIRAADGVQLWADRYDGSSQAALGFQATVSTAVAENLGVTLGLTEKQALQAAWTSSDLAYRAYLRGIAATRVMDKLKFFEQACQLDPLFVRAHMHRAIFYAWGAIGAGVDYTRVDALRSSAIEAANTVERLAPGSTEALLAAGHIEYYVRRDYSTALAFFERASELTHSDPDVEGALGAIRARLGRFDEAILAVQKSFQLDPSRSRSAIQLGHLYFGLGRFDDAHSWIQKAIDVEPLDPWPYWFQAYYETNSERARSILEAAPRFSEPLEQALVWIYSVDLPLRDFASIIQRTELLDLHDRDIVLEFELQALSLRGLAYQNLGATLEANAAWSKLLQHAMRLDAKENFPNPTLFESRARAHAGLGHRDSVIAVVDEYKRAWKKDRRFYPSALFGSAAALSMVGATDEAMENLEELSKLEFRRDHAHPSALELVYFDPLRDDPRFQELMENW